MAVFTANVSKRKFSIADCFILIFIFILFYTILKLGAGMSIPFSPEQQPAMILDPSMLPYYAGRSLLRMFIAFGASLLFTFIYGYIAAKNKFAQKLLIPLLDILQSVPVLGFLSVTIVAFMALFPGSLLGVECASIFAIFTGQAWNMTFSFYHSLITAPEDLQEAAAVLHLNWWQKLIHLEIPLSMIGLVWNGMMSFGGGWFFLAASEAISVLGENIHLPGVGSFLASAVEAGDMEAIYYSIATMLIMIILVDQLFWRPLVVWSQKFKLELSESDDVPSSFIYNLMHRSVIIHLINKWIFSPLGSAINYILNQLADFSNFAAKGFQHGTHRQWHSYALQICFSIWFIYLIAGPAQEAFGMLAAMEPSELLAILQLGFYTFIRVMIALFLGLIWTIPVGVKIGLTPKLSKFFQPLIQIAASFPANMLFPFITIIFIKYNVNFEWGSIALMMLGTQWYILFNVIAGASSIPNDLIEAASIFNIRGWKKWKTLILPSIFPHLVTGLITASGGAWNASIVSELVTWHEDNLVATGLGAYISQVTTEGDWPKIVLGITVMCIFVVIINRLVWRRLYRLAEVKYHID
jgi:NitT/TauT family transport system permease protein